MNTWIFQGNPKRFNVDDYLLENDTIWWSIRQAHLAKHILIGDEVYIWRSDGANKGSGGIVARTKVITLPQEYTNDDTSNEYWYGDVSGDTYLAVELKVHEVDVKEGIKRLELAEHSKLKDLMILKLKTNTNYKVDEHHKGNLMQLWNRTLYKRDSWKRKEDIDNYIELGSIVTVVPEQIEITVTERERVIKGRVGQSTFKRDLLNIEGKCGLCGVSDKNLLVASHIKPWSQSNNQERLDVNNGLLLCPNHDSLFDKGYISFDDDGTILISDRLDKVTEVFLNINEKMKINMNESQMQYIKWHRENRFK